MTHAFQAQAEDDVGDDGARAVERSAPLEAASLRGFPSWQVRSPRGNRRELVAVAVLSAVLHAAAVARAFQPRDAEPVRQRPSRVLVELRRPAAKKPPVVPQTPPPAANVEPPKPVAKPVRPALPATPQPIAPEPSVEPPPVDTGSSAPADVEGTLYAGEGGLGVAPPEPEPIPAPPAVAAPAPIVPAREGANYLDNPRPEYPGRARRAGWQGTTLLRVLVDPRGKPSTIRVQTSSGRSLLDDAAVEAVQKWTFVPATQGGAPISGWVNVPIVFRLQ